MEKTQHLVSMLHGIVELHNHLISCLENGQLSPFPSTVTAKKKPLVKQLNVYCCCRLPRAIEHVKHPPAEEATTMIKCYICDNLYHYSCVGITLKEAKRMNTIRPLQLVIMFLVNRPHPFLENVKFQKYTRYMGKMPASAF